MANDVVTRTFGIDFIYLDLIFQQFIMLTLSNQNLKPKSKVIGLKTLLSI